MKTTELVSAATTCQTQSTKPNLPQTPIAQILDFDTDHQIKQILPQSIHFISGLPRSGSTLLAALLRQNPRFHAGMTSAVGELVSCLLERMSNSEGAIFISPEQKRDILQSLFAAYYRHSVEDQQLIFDTNRLWCSKLPLISELFPESKIVCCVRNVAWIMDSLERLVRRNALEVSGLFNNQENFTVYSRTEALSKGDRLVGFAYNALKEAFYSEQGNKLLLVDYELLTRCPADTLNLIYQFLGEEPFEHNFEQVEYDEPEFDARLRTPGLHKVNRRVEFIPRRTVLPPDLFDRYSKLSFWTDQTNSLSNVLRFNPVKQKS
ncbi:sulfotransferase family protein [Moorena bouillonii]|uniref:sulfotransferase family protein n=1 Tax=Moorena bouillonii TaxID=207920 RepID=UPI0009D67B8F|nr:sulfotransferase [Moorena bouillonii]